MRSSVISAESGAPGIGRTSVALVMPWVGFGGEFCACIAAALINNPAIRMRAGMYGHFIRQKEIEVATQIGLGHMVQE
jgi:hypothetical protein